MSETNPVKKIIKFATVDAVASMKESAKAQYAVDKAEFAAMKAESKAQWEEAKLSPKAQAAKRQTALDQAIEEANARLAAAEARIEAAKKARGK